MFQVHWHPEIGEQVLEIARKPFDIGAIPYRVEQLTRARASPQVCVGVWVCGCVGVGV